ncbi:MAG: sensor hybrid histidine kinase [Deferribacteraceae bacterium]|nr:sensor hybrid histidine kinase [Deferribacteraceae bacterium]
MNSNFSEFFLDADVMIYKGLPDWSVEVVSGSENICGYSPEEFNSKNIGWTELIHPDDRNLVLAEARKLNENHTTISQEYRILTKSGVIKYVLDKKVSIFENGEFKGVKGIVVDISDRRVESIYGESIFRTLADFTSAGIFIFSGERFLYVNRSMLKVFGYSEYEFYNELKFWEVIHPDFREIVKQRGIDRQKGKNVPSSYDVKAITKEGRVFWASFSGKQIVFDGKPAVLGTAYDITYRVEAEQKLNEAIDRLNKAELYTKSGHWQLDLNTNTIIGSAGAKKIYGLYGEKFEYEIVKSVPLSQYRKDLDDALKNLIYHNIPYDITFKIRSNDSGLIKDIHSIAYFDKEKNIVFGIIKDITENLKDRQALIESEERFRALTNNAAAAIFVYEGSEFVYVNKGFENITGYSQDEIIGKNFWSIVHPDYQERIKQRGLARQRGEPVENRYEFKILTKDGKERWLDFTSGKITWNGKPAALGTAVDITEKKIIEDRLNHAQKLESIGRLAGGVAHEYNNMMTIILNYIEFSLMQLDKNSRLFDYISKMKNAALHTSEITKQLLSFARKQPVNIVAVDLKEFFNHQLKMMKVLLGEGVELKLDYAEDVKNIKIDMSQLNQIVTNLLVNSKDAMNGRGQIEIKLRNVYVENEDYSKYPGLKKGGYVLLEFSDSGCGIKKEHLGKIFEPFFTTKDVGKGTGLGLATVYGIVKQNNGNIYVESAEGVGTTFKIFFPPYEEISGDKYPSYGVSFKKGEGQCILLVEDEESLLTAEKTLLELLNYKVYAANNPLNALDILKENSDINLLITDIVMPDLNGKELSILAKEIKPDIKVIFMSGYNEIMLDDMKASVEDFKIDFVQKPFRIEELAEKIYNIFH